MPADCRGPPRGAPLGCAWGMANGAPAWLIAVPCRRSEALHDPASHGPQLRDLSTHDKREIASLAAVAVLSAVSVLSVGTGIIGPVRALDARPLSLAVVETPPAPSSVPIQTRAIQGPARRHSAQSASAARLALASATRSTEIVPSQPVHAVMQIAQTDVPSAQARKGPGPLKRVLFGSGQYRVQPFPVISEQEN